jgi:hypothetical protein
LAARASSLGRSIRNFFSKIEELLQGLKPLLRVCPYLAAEAATHKPIGCNSRIN